MRKIPTRKLLGVMIAGAFFLPNQAFTLGLGEIEVNSALNQQLKADIELLSATPEDAENIIVKLASRSDFSRAGLDRPYSLNDLRFKSLLIDGVPHINVTSTSPIREPFLNFLIEVDWPNGHLLREYTVLLDPPVFMSQSANTASSQANNRSASADDSEFRPEANSAPNRVPVAPVASRASSGQSASYNSTNQAPATSRFVPAPVMQQQATINQPAGSYRIKAGDTAWSLADVMRPDQSITVEQMMVAMLRSNPESFINENVNGLKRGYILRVPDYDQITSVSQSEARALVREQAALWKQYQQSQAGGQPVSAMKASKGSSASGTTAEAVTGDDAYLEIVSAGSGTSTSSAKDPTQMSAKELRAELALARERVETERVEKEALQGRVDSLEQHVDKMKGMLSIEDDALSDVQALNQPVDDQMPVTDEEAAVMKMEAEQDLAQAMSEDPETEVVGTEGEEAAVIENVMLEDAQEPAVFTDESAEAVDNMAETSMQAESAAQDFEAAPAPAPMATPEPAGLVSKLLNNPVLLAAAGAGLLLILAIIGLIVKRRKSAEAETVVTDGFDDLESVADEIAEDEASVDQKTTVSLAGDSDAESAFDSDSTMILGTDDLPKGKAADTEESRDDVIAEADVYLAYGIYQQAEDLLTQAIADNPDRDDYRVKLAETHYASKNIDAFLDVSREVQQRAGSDDSPAWKKVMVMGKDMCADNAMFQGSMVGGLDVGSLVPGAPEMDFDLGLDATDELSSDLDLSLDNEPLELPEIGDTAAADEMDLDKTQITDKETDEENAESESIDELEFDLSDTGAVEETAATEDEFSLDIDASELDIDIGEEIVAKTESVDEDSVEESLDLTDAGDIDLDFGLDDVEEEAEVLPTGDEDISIDLSDEVDSLDMDAGNLTKTEESVEISLDDVSLDDEGDFDLSSLDDVDEISTKLDLARAYLDMGDHEGTRDILTEVLTEGNDEQKQEANELMSKLD